MEHDRLQLIESRADTLLQNLKEDNHAFIYSTSILIMVSLYLLAVVFLYIKSGFSVKLLIYLVVLIGMLAYYKMSMNKAFAESDEMSKYKNIDHDDKVNYVSGMLKYLSSGFEVKLTRIHSVRLFYTILFPLFLLIVREIYVGSYTSMSFFINLALAVVVGSFWYFYFAGNQKELIEDRQEIDEMITKIYS
ncbi:MAG: hypothetical protein HKN67_14130 [Saprospiraceae bacterium]|nr:hypothetical protein [Bacteroidia bacterium]MBT8228900.1 hypothetical protein [Bacteroidia bacterium]NNF23073.1 hypothetical protein [Saprospiraceae bacterium]